MPFVRAAHGQIECTDSREGCASGHPRCDELSRACGRALIERGSFTLSYKHLEHACRVVSPRRETNAVQDQQVGVWSGGSLHVMLAGRCGGVRRGASIRFMAWSGQCRDERSSVLSTRDQSDQMRTCTAVHRAIKMVEMRSCTIHEATMIHTAAADYSCVRRRSTAIILHSISHLLASNETRERTTCDLSRLGHGAIKPDAQDVIRGAALASRCQSASHLANRRVRRSVQTGCRWAPRHGQTIRSRGTRGRAER